MTLEPLAGLLAALLGAAVVLVPYMALRARRERRRDRAAWEAIAVELGRT